MATATKRNSKAKVAYHRLNLALNRASFDKLKKIEKTIDAASMTEVVAHALRVYEALVMATEDGGTVYIAKEGGDREVMVLY